MYKNMVKYFKLIVKDLELIISVLKLKLGKVKWIFLLLK